MPAAVPHVEAMSARIVKYLEALVRMPPLSS